MRIGLISHYMPPHPGGIERVCETLFRAYREGGAEVRWVASREPRSAPRREDGRVRVATANLAERRLGVPVPVWGREGRRAVGELLRWADVVHLHDCLYVGSLLAALEARSHAPLLLTQHVGLIEYRSRLLTAVERVAYRTMGRYVLARCRRLVAATPAAEAWLDRLVGEDPARRTTIPNGIDLGRFRPPAPGEPAVARRELGLPPEAPVVLFVGRLVEKKGVDLVAATARRLPGPAFLVVGDGPLRAVVAAAGPNVRHLREVRPEDMPRVYAASSCLLLPSRGEGLPVVVQEAMASAVPVVARAGEAYAERLAARGLCVASPPDPDALARAVSGLLEGSAGPARAELRRHAETEWAEAVMVARYRRELERLAAERRSASSGR